MKNKLVIWSKNAENEKVLVALELLADTSKVKVYTFPETIAEEAFVQKMMNEWRDGKEEVVFPDGYETIERELSITESLLPDHLKVDRPDIIQRAQTEWQFAVLSAKLHASYQQELAEFKEKIEKLSAYDGKIFTSLRAFWDKVQAQSRERNLFRQHADDLRDGINTLFEQLKGMRDRLNAEFMDASQSVADRFNKALDEIEERIAAGGSKLNTVFEELKKMQREYHGARMSNEHRNQLWERIDAAFKKAKERKFGPDANAGSVAERTDRRLASLDEAIKRLEESLRRDDEELAFQRKKVNATEGQLEAQIRSAKIKMIEERAAGKRDRLAELTKARADVQRQANSAQEREARAAAKEAERQQIEAKKAAIKSEIEAETHAKAAAAQAGQKEDSLFEAATNVLGDVLLDALDTAKAVASVAAEKAEEVFEEVVERAEEALESFKKDDQAEEKEGIIIDDVVHKKEAGEPAEKEGIIIDDVVHKATPEAELESMAAADTSESIIIDDVVHKAKEEGEPDEKKEGDA
ncbi:MAG: hypothetical protein SFV22_09595 [Saprospiraceae bacterium]|nr:hypothetical protein [Saprospiraceae bacterium]